MAYGLASIRTAAHEMLRCIGKFYMLEKGIIDDDAEKAKYREAIRKISEGCRELLEVRFKDDP